MPVAADDPRLARCGFAKLSGDGGKLDVVIRKYEVLLGRPSKGKDVDVPLEGHKAVSREHARIRYNFGTSERGWAVPAVGDSCLEPLSCLLRLRAAMHLGSLCAGGSRLMHTNSSVQPAPQHASQPAPTAKVACGTLRPCPNHALLSRLAALSVLQSSLSWRCWARMACG